MKTLIIFVFLSASYFSFSQTSLRATAKDSKSKAPLAYCNIAIKGTRKGAITNADGVFSILANVNRDTLLISYVGYESRAVAAREVMKSGVVLLTKKEVMLSEVTVHATSDYLYDLLDDCRKKMLDHQNSHVAKVYYGIETQTKEQPIELLECYYNGYLRGPVIEKMLLKNGRIGLAELDHWCFLTLHSSKGIMDMDPVRRDDRTPSMPTQLGKREMKKVFNLEEVFGDKDLVDIRFTPKNNPDKDFSGEIWIDAKSGVLVKTDFTISKAARHPFLPLFSCDTISNVDITVSRSYRQEEGASLPDHISFNYHITYKSFRKVPDSLKNWIPTTHLREINTKGIEVFYDYGEPFILPYFNYDPDFDDYRKISIIPYSEIFWDNNNTLLLTDKQKENLGFLAREGNMYTYDNREYGKDFLMNLEANGSRVFQNYYTFWSPVKRIMPNKEVIGGTIDYKAIKNTMMLADLYNLKVQLLVDVNGRNDSLLCKSYTVFDSKESFFQLKEQPSTKAFLNIFFDICEIERRAMQAELDSKSYTASQIDAIYKKAVDHLDLITKQYFREVKLGADVPALIKWNDQVKTNLEIDNLALFPITGKE